MTLSLSHIQDQEVMCETLSQLMSEKKSFTNAQVDKCIGFTWQGFDSGGHTEVDSVRRHQGLPSMSESVSASSKMDPSLAKAKPISDAGGTFVKLFKKVQKPLHWSCEREWGKYETVQISGQWVRGTAPGTRVCSCAAPGEARNDAGCPPTAHEGSHQ